MANFTYTVSPKGICTVTFDLTKNVGASQSGKSVNISTTNGNIQIGQTKDGRPIKLGVNCFYPTKATEVEVD